MLGIPATAPPRLRRRDCAAATAPPRLRRATAPRYYAAATTLRLAKLPAQRPAPRGQPNLKVELDRAAHVAKLLQRVSKVRVRLGEVRVDAHALLVVEDAL